MKLLRFACAIALTSLPTLGFGAADPLVGIWSGKATCAGDEAELFFRFTEDAAGELSAAFDLPTTNVIDASLGKVVRGERGYDFAVCHVEFDPSGEKLNATLDYQGTALRFTLTRAASAPVAAKSSNAPSSAAPVWKFPTGGPVWSSPTASGGSVYIGSNDGCAYALEATSGRALWKFQTGGPVVARPTADSGALYVPSDAGRLFKLDARTGAETWRADLRSSDVVRDWPSATSGTYDYLASAATVADGVVFVGSGDGRLYAFDAATGAERWSFATGDRVRSTPAVAGELVLFGGCDGFVYAVERATGKLRWKSDTLAPVTSSPTLHAGVAYIGSRSANVLALDAATGAERWRHYLWLSWVESSAVVRDETLYVGSSDYQRLSALELASGRARWRFDTDGSAWSTPAVTASTVYIGAVGVVGYMADHRGAFFAVDRATGREKWRIVFPELAGSYAWGVASSPTVAGPRVCFGSLDGNVYACAAE